MIFTFGFFSYLPFAPPFLILIIQIQTDSRCALKKGKENEKGQMARRVSFLLGSVMNEDVDSRSRFSLEKSRAVLIILTLLAGNRCPPVASIRERGKK